MIAAHSPYSYRDDPAVPEFSVTGVATVMDAHCALCARGATWIARHDRAQEFTIIPVQSELGSALMRHYGLDPTDPLSWLYLENGRAYSSLDALMRAGRRLGGVWKGLTILRILPAPLQDRLYAWVARNRYRMFGRADLCALPDPDVQKRLLR
ncbi:MAG: thiol-disulfide oxidoreductase DCC family protein [Paracoccaceae bacterium]